MVSSRRKPAAILTDAEERADRIRMFIEYREENAKDMEREARSDW